jgi:hypothetical protein
VPVPEEVAACPAGEDVVPFGVPVPDDASGVELFVASVAGAAVPDAVFAGAAPPWSVPHAVRRPRTATVPANRAPRRRGWDEYAMSLNTPG